MFSIQAFLQAVRLLAHYSHVRNDQPCEDGRESISSAAMLDILTAPPPTPPRGPVAGCEWGRVQWGGEQGPQHDMSRTK